MAEWDGRFCYLPLSVELLFKRFAHSASPHCWDIIGLWLYIVLIAWIGYAMRGQSCVFMLLLGFVWAVGVCLDSYVAGLS